MRLRELIDGLDWVLVSGSLDQEVAGVQHDSRHVRPGDLFVSIKGLKYDGHDFIHEAFLRGAKAFVVERSDAAVPSDLTVIRVGCTRRALASLSCRFYGEPSKRLLVIGVTGTNGKTTTTYLLESILKAAGRKVGLIGTVSYRFGGRELPAERTTPEASDLQAFLAEILREGADSVVLEVSSHSLALSRVEGLEFDGAVFTNLTQDHLDFHGSFEAYLQAKAKLFQSLGEGVPKGAALSRAKGVEKAAFLNADDPYGDRIASLTRAKVYRYGVERRGDLTAEKVELSLEGIQGKIISPWGSFPFHSPLVGRHNLSNILAAVGVGLHLGIPPESVAEGIAQLQKVPGRFEKVEAGQPFSVVVDYAHTPDALERVLKTAKGFCRGRLIAVFGCGGDRDRSKRPKMGEAAARIADLVVLTSDNPRSEDPQRIIAEIEEGAKKVWRDGEGYVKIADRRLAIEAALSRVKPSDLVLIAGKGHETYQIIGERTLPFDDREVAREVLARLGYKPL